MQPILGGLAEWRSSPGCDAVSRQGQGAPIAKAIGATETQHQDVHRDPTAAVISRTVLRRYEPGQRFESMRLTAGRVAGPPKSILPPPRPSRPAVSRSTSSARSARVRRIGDLGQTIAPGGVDAVVRSRSRSHRAPGRTWRRRRDRSAQNQGADAERTMNGAAASSSLPRYWTPISDDSEPLDIAPEAFAAASGPQLPAGKLFAERKARLPPRSRWFASGRTRGA